MVREGTGVLRAMVRERLGVLAAAVAGAVLFTTALVASALVVGHITEDLVVPVLRDGEPSEDKLLPAMLLLLGVGLWKSVGIVLRRAGATYLQYGAKNRLRRRIVAHQLGLSMRWYRGHSTGDLLSVSDEDTRAATLVLGPLPYTAGVAVLMVISIVVLTVIDVFVGLASVVVLAGIAWLDVWGSWVTFAARQEVQHLKGRVSDVAHESFDGALTIKALGSERHETARFAEVATDLLGKRVEVGQRWATYQAGGRLLPALGSVLVLLVGVIRLDAGAVTSGDLVTVTYLLTLLMVPLQLFGYLLGDLTQSVAAWRRVRGVLEEDDRVEHGDLEPLVTGPAAVRGVDVSFGYDPGPPVLRDVHLDIPPGRTLAVVGPTGSGKSTLALLLARLWDPDHGSVRLDGRDLRRLAPGAVPTEVAYVAQHAFLFDDTVRGNITLGADIGQARLEEAARLARADGFVGQLPRGYETPIGERGATLSGGQQQRLALARALVRRPRLLILDDATSAVDPSVESDILRGLKAADLPSTIVVVAYRPSSIVLADEVIYVDDGRVIAQGTHEHLLATQPGYADLLEAYARDARERLDAAP